jgi:hypothetical protein
VYLSPAMLALLPKKVAAWRSVDRARRWPQLPLFIWQEEAQSTSSPPPPALFKIALVWSVTLLPIGSKLPVLGKNVMAASNALSCANMALAGYQHLIPFDEVVVAMNKVAHQIPRELRCTNLGGLSITPTADKIAAKLAAKSCDCKSSCKG